MRAEDPAFFYGPANLTKRHSLRLAIQNGTSLWTAQSRNEPGLLQFDKDTPDDHRVCIDCLSKPGGGVAMILLQSQHSHHVNRKGEPAIVHPKTVTNGITLSNRKTALLWAAVAVFQGLRGLAAKQIEGPDKQA